MSAVSRMPTQPIGKTLLLSASIPPSMNEETSEDRLHVAVEEAIISIGRAAFARRIRVAYGGAPHLALLLAGLASEYALPRYAEGPNIIHEDDGVSTSPQLVAYISRPLTLEQGLMEDVELLARAGAHDGSLGRRRSC